MIIIFVCDFRLSVNPLSISSSAYLLVVQSTGMQRHRDQDGFPEPHVGSLSEKECEEERLNSPVPSGTTHFDADLRPPSTSSDGNECEIVRGEFRNHGMTRREAANRASSHGNEQRTHESIVRHALSGSGRHSLGDQGKKGMGLTVRHVEAVRKGARVQPRGLSTHDRHPRFTLSSLSLLSLYVFTHPRPRNTSGTILPNRVSWKNSRSLLFNVYFNRVCIMFFLQ